MFKVPCHVFAERIVLAAFLSEIEGHKARKF